MAYVPVPKDLTKVKTKVAFNLTKRQLICFGSGALIGVPLFFLCRGSLGTSTAALVMVLTMLPFSFWRCTSATASRWRRWSGSLPACTSCAPKSAPIRPTTFTPPLRGRTN